MQSKKNIESPIIIAIDGYAASGKGVLAKNIAKHFGFDYLDTGALYRIVAYYCLKNNIESHDANKIVKLIQSINFHEFSTTEFLHRENVSQKASEIAQYSEVREALNDYQKKFPIGKKGVVVDGRDIGTVIFPNANCKIFVTADIEERSKRRFEQLKVVDKSITYVQVLKDLKKRDERDKRRQFSPLKKAEGAFLLDTTTLTKEASLMQAITYCNKKILTNYNLKI